MKGALIAGALVLVVAVTLWRVNARRAEVAQREEAARAAAQRYVDLSEVADPASKPVKEAPPKPARGKKPVMVEIKFKGSRAPFTVVDSTGHTIADGFAGSDPAVLILSPGEYEVRVPKKKFRHALNILGTETETKRVTLVLNR